MGENLGGGILEEESWGKNLGGGILEEEPWGRNPGGGILEEESWRRNTGGGTNEVRRHFGRLWEALGELWGHQGRSKEPKADFEVNLVKTYVFYHQKRRERPFRRRVAKVGVTKYRILHGSSADAQPERRRYTQSPAVTHAARNPTVEHCLGKLPLVKIVGKPGVGAFLHISTCCHSNN